MARIQDNGLTFALNQNDLTASIVGTNNPNENIEIPRSITYQDQDYIIISINDQAFNNNQIIKSISFSKDSMITLIDSKAFYSSKIEKISIPSFVTKIGDYAFYNCNKLQSIEIPSNSKLQSIGFYAFQNSSIGQIKIPAHTNDIKSNSFANTLSLNSIEVSPENKRFKYSENLLLYKSNEKSSDYDVAFFAPRNIDHVTIPKNIKEIGMYAFHQCKNLKTVDFEENSELHIINK